MKKFKEKYLTAYVLEKSKTCPDLYKNIFYSSLKRSILAFLFIIFPISKNTGKKILVSGNLNKKFYKFNDSISYAGLPSIHNDKYQLNMALLYIVTFLYAFSSRRFACIFRNTINKYRQKLKDSDVEYIFVHSDALPIIRALILAIKPTNIKVICIQHGVYHSKLENQIDGIYSDYAVVMNKNQIGFFLDSGVPINKIINYSDIIGNISQDEQSPLQKNFSKVILIGENIQSIDKAEDKIVFKKYLLIKKICENAGIKVYFRPKPNEKKSISRIIYLYINGFRFRKGHVEKDALYIGTVSSFLLHVANNGGSAIRITGSKKLSTKGISLSIRHVTLHRLTSILKRRSILLPTNSNNLFVMEYDVKLIISEIQRKNH